MVESKEVSPEEKIKKMKKLKEAQRSEASSASKAELSAEKKKEIADAHKKIKDAGEEQKEKREFKEKMPASKPAKQDLEGLSEEGKDILREQRRLKEDKEKRGYGLEQLAREKTDLPPEVLESQYAEQLSREPIRNIYKEMGSIHKAVEEKGYISREEEKRVEYLNSAVERKLEAEESGSYSFSEEAARAASLTRQMGASMINSYKSGHKSGLYRSS